ncbi:hypothetical protein [Novosphingobium taihuense]|uniref:Uncharacterized protein n=1 Tax=Novosphingobium taihuense TaxID=260085 RepID=A0A7W7ES50_9SPHN|nr:hypothetical protein [Novosphingobium taihuense]MBB4611928.1 hypothetical protein [Novosphingobium taihuense]TWH88719.1 hypothetical protein IQ25_00842 [Novosphingobium taihuense]
MTLQAFNSSQAVKVSMIEPVRKLWLARAVVPDVDLVWNGHGKASSISGLLGRTDDRETFEQRTGIPADLAKLCECLLTMGITKTPASDAAAIAGNEALLAFGTEWLDAIAPGAELGMTVPRFARHCMDLILRPDFPLAVHVSPALVEAAGQIRDLWDRELAGQSVSRGEWRGVQRAAMSAAASDGDAWAYRIASFIEGIAWPIATVSHEFTGLFEPMFFNCLMFEETAFMTDEERSDRAHMLLGWKAMATAPRDEIGLVDPDPLEAHPESARVLSAEYLEQMMGRMAEIRAAAQGRKDTIIRETMDTVLRLIRSA